MSGEPAGTEVYEPLINPPRAESSGQGSNSDANATEQVDHSVLKGASRTVHFLTLSAGISGLLFGYDTGVISSTLVSIRTDLSGRALTTLDKSIITAITSLLALLFAPTTGFFADRYGRKSVILFPALLFALGAVIQAVAGTVWIMALGRALVGAAVGVASGAVPLYITELAPAELRGRLVTIQSLFITGGQVIAYLFGWLFATTPHGWRYMVGLGAIPAIAQLFLLPWMPETPRWLLKTGQDEKARSVLLQVYRNLAEPEQHHTVADIISSVKDELTAENTAQGDGHGVIGKTSHVLRELLEVPGHRRALTIACMLQGLQQLCGFNSLMYFSATIFALVGFSSPIGTSLSVALTNFAFTLVAFAYIDTVGRRNILLRSIPFMTLGLLACSFAFYFIKLPAETPSYDTDRPSSGFWPVSLLFSMILYVSAYAVGLGCVPWQQSELFPLSVRSLGSGLATATNWSSNFIVGMTFLPMMAYLGPSITFALYAVVCLTGWICIYLIYPETAGLPIEKIGELLKHGWGVEQSIVLHAERQDD